METIKLHSQLVVLKIIAFFRSCMSTCGILYIVYRLIRYLWIGFQTKNWFPPNMFTECAVLIGLIMLIFILSTIKDILDSRLNEVAGQIAYIQHERSMEQAHQQFLREEQQKERMAQEELQQKMKTLKSTLKSKHGTKSLEETTPPPHSEAIYTPQPQNTDEIRKFQIQTTSPDPEKELNELIGMRSVKEQISRIQAMLEYEKEFGPSQSKQTLHMRFAGGPGTGKTTVGRIVAGILYREHLIPQNKYLEINGNDLIGRFLGDTPLVVKNAFEQAAGGVIFIDEVYALSDSARTENGGGYGSEAVTQLLTHLENNKNGTVVIVAGYPDQMNRFFEMNPGLPSRIPQTIMFPDYSAIELLQIAEGMLNRAQHSISREAMEALYKIIQKKSRICQQIHQPFGNARYIRNVVDELHRQHAINYKEKLVVDQTICLADIVEGNLLSLN